METFPCEIKNHESQITSTLTRLMYQEENVDILTIAAYLLYKVSIGHNYTNGNKRTALFMMMNFLEFCGLWLCGREIKYTKKWEKLIENIVKDSSKIQGKQEQERDKIENEIIERIKKTIKPHIKISFRWRKYNERKK